MSRRREPALRAASDREPGLRRLRRGAGFAYADARGAPVRGAATLARIRRLAIPPAWRDVWICASADGHVQAVGRDALGRKQYRYHAEWIRRRSESKYARLDELASRLPELRARVARDLGRPGLPRRKVVALVVRLLERTLIRVGNSEYAARHDSYGLTTLQDRHALVRGSSIVFEFRGKSRVQHELLVRDRGLARLVRQCRELPGQTLFQYEDARGRLHAVDSGDVNDYLRAALGGDFTAKDFRTWGGTCLAVERLHEAGPPRSAAASKRAAATAVRAVAVALGNRPATCRKHYIHPAVIEAHAEGRLDALVERPLAGSRSGRAHGLTPLERATRAVLIAERRRLRAGHVPHPLTESRSAPMKSAAAPAGRASRPGQGGAESRPCPGRRRRHRKAERAAPSATIARVAGAAAPREGSVGSSRTAGDPTGRGSRSADRGPMKPGDRANGRAGSTRTRG